MMRFDARRPMDRQEVDFDPSRTAATLPDNFRHAFASYPKGWTDAPLPYGWSGTAIGKIPLVDIQSGSLKRRVNERGEAVQRVLIDFNFGLLVSHKRKRPRCSNCERPASRAGDGLWAWNCDCHVFLPTPTQDPKG